MLTALTIFGHLLPVLITLALLLVALAIFVGIPYCRYVLFVSHADTSKGREDLARYLAKKTGGRKTDVSQLWPSFLPAASQIHKDHEDKKRVYHETHPE